MGEEGLVIDESYPDLVVTKILNNELVPGRNRFIFGNWKDCTIFSDFVQGFLSGVLKLDLESDTK